MSDWRIRRENEVCTSCERAFEPGEALFSVLILDEEGLGRRDLCQACFEAEAPSEAEGPTRIYWRTRRRTDEKRGLAVDFDAVEGLFHALDGRDEERLRELRYLLCLLLMRKRRVKLLRVARSDEAELLIVRRPRREEELRVEVFDLTPEKAEELRGQLEAIFEGSDLELAAPPAG